MREEKTKRSDCSVCHMARLPVWGVKKLLCKGSSMLGAGRRLNKGLVRKGLFWSNWVLWAETPLIRDLLQESGFMVSKQWDFREGICSPLGFHRNLSVISVPLSWLSAPVFLRFQSDYFHNMDRCGWTVELSKWYSHIKYGRNTVQLVALVDAEGVNCLSNLVWAPRDMKHLGFLREYSADGDL